MYGGLGWCNGVVIIFMIYCMVGLGGCNGVVIIFMIFIFVTVRWPRSV